MSTTAFNRRTLDEKGANMSWKSVKDELPKIGQKVILFSNGVVQEETFMFDMADKNDLETECFWSRDDLEECPELQQSDFWQSIPTTPSSHNSN